ncbi:MAG: hypothetical protein DRQ58_11500 [Gammaproteobacteria bacterium]|nr:MAG: hypothetical protein DRQ58_11500 [Gammaproteobacteria bacterium]
MQTLANIGQLDKSTLAGKVYTSYIWQCSNAFLKIAGIQFINALHSCKISVAQNTIQNRYSSGLKNLCLNY